MTAAPRVVDPPSHGGVITIEVPNTKESSRAQPQPTMRSNAHFRFREPRYLAHGPLAERGHFVKRHRPVRAERLVWLFRSGPLGTDLVDEEGRDILEAIRPTSWLNWFLRLGRRSFSGPGTPRRQRSAWHKDSCGSCCCHDRSRGGVDQVKERARQTCPRCVSAPIAGPVTEPSRHQGLPHSEQGCCDYHRPPGGKPPRQSLL